MSDVEYELIVRLERLTAENSGLKARLAELGTEFAKKYSEIFAREAATRARLAEALIELNEASPIETCQGCGEQDRRHRMMLEEGDRWECPACWDKYNAIDADGAGEGRK